jgi:hypothetical protein
LVAMVALIRTTCHPSGIFLSISPETVAFSGGGMVVVTPVHDRMQDYTGTGRVQDLSEQDMPRAGLVR